MTIIQEIVNQFRQQQEKYIYYLIALSVASIAFSVHNTLGEAIKWAQLPLGISVILWGTSIYCGLTAIQYFISSLPANIDLILAQRSKSPEETDILKVLKEIGDRTKKLIKVQRNTFYLGIIFYVAWHITEMIIRANS